MRSMQSYVCDFTLPLIIWIGFLVSVEPGVETQSIAIDPSTCTKEDLMVFFPQPIVKAVLIRHHFSDSDAEHIAKMLAGKQSEIIHIIENKASQVHPNPFEDLSQRDVALKIFKETLYQVLRQVLQTYQKTNKEEIQAILEDTRVVRGRLFIECIKRGDQPSTSK